MTGEDLANGFIGLLNSLHLAILPAVVTMGEG
jgi:hypothetical protein